MRYFLSKPQLNCAEVVVKKTSSALLKNGNNAPTRSMHVVQILCENLSFRQLIYRQHQCHDIYRNMWVQPKILFPTVFGWS